ncbi:phage resistance protein [Micromonospora sp. U21]|uniref:phage resistance protein n=1 Tax=Micromonospora sp. U21 TaxID=2824899 RepID=UPI001B3627C9|nr:phage resistance protein [Micromonospora sp. U21]MBQ0905034.1 phage resistance protein [Micromonospora sp. U21]
MTLLRDVIDIPTSVGDGDFVVRAAEGADLRRYVVTDQLRENFAEALRRIGHAVTTGRSQAMFLHGSFGSGKSHFMAVLREILQHNPAAREVRGLAEPVLAADTWLRDRKLLTLTFHMLDARSVEQAVLEGYLNQITKLHPEAPVPAVHRSDALLDDAARLRERMGDDAFFAALHDGGGAPAAGGGGLAALVTRAAGWTPQSYAAAAAAPPGTAERDRLVSALTSTFFTGAVRSGEYLDLDTGLAVITRHAKSLGYDALVLFLDELILWLSTKISDHTFVNTEGAKLNKLVESADATRPLPLISFVARQRNLEDFLGPQVGGTEREALAHVMRSVQGRFGEIALADTNLPEITEKRLLKPIDDAARAVLDNAFAAVRGNREVWDALLLGAQYGDAGIGSDAAAFRKLYPFSPALVATLVALSQALQRERTALKVMTELLVDRRDTLQVNDLIGVAALFDPLVLHGELPDRPKLKQLFQSARSLYTQKLRPILLNLNGIGEEQAAGHQQFQLDDKLIKTVLLGALVPEVPALHNLTAAKLHALNFGSITSPIPGYERQIVLNRLNRVSDGAGELHLTKTPDPVVTLKLHTVDYDKLLDLVPEDEATTTGVRQQLIRELVTAEMGIAGAEGQLGELLHSRDWRGRRHTVQVKFGNVRDPDTMPVSALIATGEAWRVIIDYPFDPQGYERSADRARIERLERGSRTVFWLPFFLTDEMMGKVAQLAKINYLLGSGTGDRLNSLAADWPLVDRQQGKVYLQQRQTQLRGTLLSALMQAYGAGTSHGADVQDDSIGVFHTLTDGLHVGDPRGGTLAEAFKNLTGELLAWSYPGRPAMPDDEKPVTRSEMTKILEYARQAAADSARGVSVLNPVDQRTLRRVCNNLRLGELIDGRYVLTTSTCRWSQHLLQAAANEGYTDHFPVHVLRRLIDEPAAFGFDRELQNLIIVVFGLEQQLAWYQHGGKLDVTTLAAVRDDLELRHPPMPDEQAWADAVRRGSAIFGGVLPVWRTPANLGNLAGTLRSAAGARKKAAGDLVDALTSHADVLGLDLSAAAGRLATARRAARFVTELAAERDDVVLVETAARANLGDVDDQAVGEVLGQAGKISAALAQAHQWPLLQAIVARSAHDERAQVIIGQLREVARREQHGQDLVDAFQTAVAASAALLAADEQSRPTDRTEVTRASGGTTPGTTDLLPTQQRPQDADPTRVRTGDHSGAEPNGGGTGTLPGGAGAGLVSGGSGSGVMAGGGGSIPVTQQRREVTDAATWEKVAAEIEAEVAAGRPITVTWEIR